MKSDKWDLRFIELAKLVSTWSKDNSTKVGCVITDNMHRVISMGFNGFPRGVEDEILTREQKLMRTIHAEANALHFANRSVASCTAYVTHPPCSNCAASLIQRGIIRIVYPKPDAAFLERWKDSHDEALTMFFEAGIIITEISVH